MLLCRHACVREDKQWVKVEEGVARAPGRFRKDIGPVSIGVEISKRRHAICDHAQKKKKEEEKKRNKRIYASDSPLCSRGRYPLFGI